MGWDSNPRYACTHAGFQDRCLKPLGHPSLRHNQDTRTPAVDRNRSFRNRYAAGRVQERAYLGEHWEYTIRIEADSGVLRVTAPPFVNLDVGSEAWLSIDPGHVVALPPDDGNRAAA